MSDISPRYGQQWYQWSSKSPQSILERHFTELQEIDLQRLWPFIHHRALLDTGESNAVCDRHKSLEERLTLLLRFVGQKCGRHYCNNHHGLMILVECLRDSGSTHHLKIAWQLSKSLHDTDHTPEDFINQRKQNDFRRRDYSELMVSITERLKTILPDGSLLFKQFREFVGSCVHTSEHKLAVYKSTSTEEILHLLKAHQYVEMNNTKLLRRLLQTFDSVEDSSDKVEELRQLEKERIFVGLTLELAKKVGRQVTIHQLKLCILSTTNQFGHYYRTLEDEEDAKILVKLVHDWDHPQLTHRIARCFHPELESRLEERNRATQEDLDDKERLYIAIREEYIDILMKISNSLEGNLGLAGEFLRWFSSISLSLAHPTLRLVTGTPSNVSNALLSLAPFSSYHSTFLLEHITNNLLVDSRLHETLSSATKTWKEFTAHTPISRVYNLQLDSLPLQLCGRNIAVLSLHMDSEEWADPNIDKAVKLVRDTAETFHLYPWSLVYHLTVFTAIEPGRKGRARVDMFIPVLAGCIILRDGSEKKAHWEANSITYLELVVETKCYLSGDTASIEQIHTRAKEQTYFSPFLKVLNNN